MAIALRYNFFVVRKAGIERNYPGGMTRFRSEWIKSSSESEQPGEDEHLIGFCSMGNALGVVLDSLLASGLELKQNDRVLDIACGDELAGIDGSCDWLEVRKSEWTLDSCWLAGTEPGQLREPIFR